MAEDNNPWGKKKSPQNIDDLVDESLKKIQNMLFPPKKPPENGKAPEPGKSSSISYLIFLVALVFLVGWQSFYIIQPGEKGVVLRFGKYSRTGEAGLNFTIPFIEKVYTIDVESIRTLEFGFRGPSERDLNSRSYLSNSRTYDTESLMLTGDKNVINLNWVVQYRISDPKNYLFKTQDPVSLVSDTSEFVLRRLVGNRDFDYVLDKREEVAFQTETEMQSLLDLEQYNVGIKVVKVQLLDVTPPEKVRPSFNEVNEADQDKTRLENEAQKLLNERIPKARGQAQQLIEKAQGYAIERLNRAEGDVSRFKDIYGQYRNYKSVTRTRLYLETMRQVLPNVKELVIADKKNTIVPILNLSNSGQGTLINAK